MWFRPLLTAQLTAENSCESQQARTEHQHGSWFRRLRARSARKERIRTRSEGESYIAHSRVFCYTGEQQGETGWANRVRIELLESVVHVGEGATIRHEGDDHLRRFATTDRFEGNRVA